MKKLNNRFYRLWLIFILVFGTANLGCKGPQGPEGPQGPAGPGTDPSISGVSPRSVFLERQVDVTISGSGTSWTSDVSVDFGQGITVLNVTVSSATALIATIFPARNADLRTRNVTVSEQGEELVFSDGFEIKAPLTMVESQGTIAQGSIVIADLQQLDSSTPFDARSSGGMTGPIQYPYLNTFLEGSGSQGRVLQASEFHLKARFSLDVSASTGPTTLVVESGTEARSDSSALPGALDVAPRIPTELSPGTTTSGTVNGSYESLLYSATASAGQLVSVNVSASSPDANPIFFHLPESGSFSDVISNSTQTQLQFVAAGSPKTNYFVYFDSEGISGYDITIGVEEFTTSSESEPNDDSGSANNLTGAIVGDIGSVGDQDYFAVSATTGQTIELSSGSGITDPCPEADSELEIYDTDGTTSLAFSDDDFCDGVSATVSGDGTYFVRLGPSASFCSDCTFDYSLLITVQ